MAEIKKGIVTQIVDGKAIIRPYGSGAALTHPLPVQHINIGGTLYNHPVLAAGDPVAFAMFNDGTGIVIDKLTDDYQNEPVGPSSLPQAEGVGF